jgi:hypothetical protein
VERAVLQRRTRHKNWSVPAIDEQRRQIDQSGKKRAWGKSTLHQMISKVVLDAIHFDLEAALKSRDTDLRAAAAKFSAALTKAANAAGLPENITRDKQLWNIPFNLVAGPGIVSNNPGEGFDASYREVVDPDEVPRFVETDVSKHLRAVEHHYRKGRRETASGRGLTTEAWDGMTAAFLDAMAAAAEAGDVKDNKNIEGLANVTLRAEQWFASRGGTTRTRFPARPGSARVPGVTRVRSAA